ncbi:MAG TPA: NADPH-dependent FMN reductase [Gemmatimonadaceae bacterium]|nr:NADPH-dependent FMN reductase [Gemmatimonadaceae bacterium]
MYILAISGSLRTGASNTTVLQAAALLAPPGVTITLYDGLGALPHFNPDLDSQDGDQLPAIVADLREQIGRADGVLISCPEYAHGIPGSFKNLLDWLVGSTEFPGKPVALLNTSPMSVHAPAQLAEILTTMNARLIREASVTVQPRSRGSSAGDIATDPEVSVTLRNAIVALIDAAHE